MTLLKSQCLAVQVPTHALGNHRVKSALALQMSTVVPLMAINAITPMIARHTPTRLLQKPKTSVPVRAFGCAQKMKLKPERAAAEGATSPSTKCGLHRSQRVLQRAQVQDCLKGTAAGTCPKRVAHVGKLAQLKALNSRGSSPASRRHLCQCCCHQAAMCAGMGPGGASSVMYQVSAVITPRWKPTGTEGATMMYLWKTGVTLSARWPAPAHHRCLAMCPTEGTLQLGLPPAAQTRSLALGLSIGGEKSARIVPSLT